MGARRCAAVFAILFSLATSTTTAQSATGEIQGTLVTGSGAAVPGVTVTITNIATGATRETFTDRAGFFAAPGLPPGLYDVQASVQGFATQRQPSLAVQVGQVMTLRLELRVAPAPETITLAHEAPMVEMTRSQVSAAISSTELEHLPVRGRNALGLALLTPGVGIDATGRGISVLGQHGTFNTLLVDGVDRSRSTSAPRWISLEATQGLQISTSAYTAEYGRAPGGIIHVVTKAGSNELNGSAFAFRGGGASNGASNQFGGWAGGPIVRDRHFAYGIYDSTHDTTEHAVSLNLPPRVPTDAATRSAVNRLDALATPWERTQEHDLFRARTDHQLTDAHRLAFRYHGESFAGRGFDANAAHVTADAARALETSTHAFTATATSAIGSALFNDARLSLGRDRETGDAGTDAPQATIRQDGSDVLRIGANVFNSGDATVKRLQVADTLTWFRGAHKLKTGFDVVLDGVVSAVPGHFSGAYVFDTLASFTRGTPSAPGDTFTQAFEGAGTSGRMTKPDTNEYSIFLQDEWRVAPELTLNAGVRYDAQTFAQPEGRNPDAQLAAAGIDTSSIRADRNNFGPRVGAAFAVSERLIVRGGYGIVYGRTPWPMVASAHAYNGMNVQTITVRAGSDVPVPALPSRFQAVPSGAALRPTIIAFDAGYQNPRVQQASAGFDWEWMRNTALSVNYLLVRGDQLPRATDRNIGTAMPATFTVIDESGNPSGTVQHYRFAPGPFTNFARVIAYESTAQSRYRGVGIELTRRFSQGHQYRLSYAFGKVNDTVPDATALIPESLDDRKFASNPAAFDTDNAPGRADHRHRFVGAVIYDSNRFADRFNGFMRSLFSDWMLSAIYTAQTGVPFSAYVSADINGDNNRFNDLAPGTTRNQGRLGTWFSLDPRLARNIGLKGETRVTLIWEAFNLLNQANQTVVNDTLYQAVGTQLRVNPLFGQALAQMEPRTMRLGVRLSF